jgi:hypothetical protein
MGLSICLAIAVVLPSSSDVRIHSMTDISHEFTFYMDGRFWKQYIGDARGSVLVASRGLFGHRPDASDPIDATWIKPLLVDLVRSRPVNPSRPPKSQAAELSHRIDDRVKHSRWRRLVSLVQVVGDFRRSLAHRSGARLLTQGIWNRINIRQVPKP